MEQLGNDQKFLFIYNSITDNNLNFGYNVDKFCQKYQVVVEFTTYNINFKIIS